MANHLPTLTITAEWLALLVRAEIAAPNRRPYLVRIGFGRGKVVKYIRHEILMTLTDVDEKVIGKVKRYKKREGELACELAAVLGPEWLCLSTIDFESKNISRDDVKKIRGLPKVLVYPRRTTLFYDQPSKNIFAPGASHHSPDAKFKLWAFQFPTEAEKLAWVICRGAN